MTQTKPPGGRLLGRTAVAMAIVAILGVGPTGALGFVPYVGGVGEDSNSDCNNLDPTISAGQEAEGAMDPVSDTEDAVGLGFEEEHVGGVAKIMLEAGRESEDTPYTIRADLFAGPTCSGDPVLTMHVSNAETVAGDYTPTDGVTHAFRLTLEDYGSNPDSWGLLEPVPVNNHCFPHCLVDWAVHFVVDQMP